MEPAGRAGHRLRWRMLRATLFLAACLGLSIFLLTGRRDTAAAVGLIAGSIFPLAAWFAPERLERRRPPGFFYAVGVVALVLPFAQLALGLEWTPWADLEGPYRPRANVAPDGFAGGSEVVIVVPTGQFMAKPYSYRRASSSFGSEGVLLKTAWPMSLVYDPLFIPLAGISACRTSEVSSMRSALSLVGSAFTVEVSDPEGRVIEWCRLHDIGDGRPGAAAP